MIAVLMHIVSWSKAVELVATLKALNGCNNLPFVLVTASEPTTLQATPLTTSLWSCLGMALMLECLPATASWGRAQQSLRTSTTT